MKDKNKNEKTLMDKMNSLKTTHPCLAEVETELDLMGEVEVAASQE